jgi:DNA-binding transcriptional ArsR family regulator
MTGQPGKGDLADTANLFRVIGHDARLRLLIMLATREYAVSELEGASGIGQPGLSQQLAILRKAKLVTTRRDAKQVCYRIDPTSLTSASTLLSQLAAPPGATNQASPVPSKPALPGSAAGFARML